MKHYYRLLFAAIAFLTAAFTSHGEEKVKFTVETPDASIVHMYKGWYWDGIVIPLQDGVTECELNVSESSVSVKPENGYKIEELTLNGTQIEEYSDRAYYIDNVPDGAVIKIKVIKVTTCYLNLKNVSFMHIWDGWSSEGKELTFDDGDWQIYEITGDNPSLSVTPADGYCIAEVIRNDQRIGVSDPTTQEYHVEINDGDNITLRASEIMLISINVDVASRVCVKKGEYEWGEELALHDGINEVAVPVWNPQLTITAKEGYWVDSVQRKNTNYGWSSSDWGYYYSISPEKNDVITIKSSVGTNYTFTVDVDHATYMHLWRDNYGAGPEITLQDGSNTIEVCKAYRFFSVTPADGYWIDEVKHNNMSNGFSKDSETNVYYWGIYDVKENDKIEIKSSMGTNYTFTVDVDHAAYVHLWRDNYGAKTDITLQDGSNTIEVSKADRNFSVSAADGYWVDEVKKNDENCGYFGDADKKEYQIYDVKENDAISITTSRLIYFTLEVNDASMINAKYLNYDDSWWSFNLQNGTNSLKLSDKNPSIRIYPNHGYHLREVTINGTPQEVTGSGTNGLTIPTVSDGDVIVVKAEPYVYGVEISYDGRYMGLGNNENESEIRYTLDGSDPTTGTVYSGKFDVGGLRTVKAVTLKGGTFSEVTEYEIKWYSDDYHAYVAEPNMLSRCLEWAHGEIPNEEGHLIVEGPLGQDDFNWFGNYRPGLRHLDLEKAKVEVLPSDAFRYSSLTTVSLPSSLESYELGAFKDCWQISAVIWNAPKANITKEFRRGLNNPNMLLYLQNNEEYDIEGGDMKNIVINGHAETVSLSNNGRFHAPLPFTADQIRFSRGFYKTTPIDGCAGWETLALPFDVEKVLYNGKEAKPFAAGEAGLNYWLFEPNENGWNETTAISAYKPYLIAMPNNNLYDYEFNIQGEIVFSAENASIGSTADNIQGAPYRNGCKLWPSFSNVDDYSGIMTTNNEEYEGNAPGSVFVRGMRNVDSFECYLTSSTMQKCMAVIEGKSLEKVTLMYSSGVKVENGDLLIDSDISRRIMVYDTSGRIVRIVEVAAGETSRVQGLAPGVYIVGKSKIMIK